MASISDILAHYVLRAKECIPTKGAADNPQSFLKWIRTLPVKQQKFDSFFGADGRLRTDLFDQLWSCKDDGKSPGAPLYFEASNNAALEPYKAEIYEVVDQRIAKLVALGQLLHSEGLIGVSATPEQRVDIVRLGLADVMAVGLKSEARKNGKTPRLISLASLCDNLVTRVGYHNFLIDLMDSPEKYMCARLDVTTQSKTAERYAVFKKRGEQTGNDVRGWEYSMNESDQWACMWADAYSMGLVDRDLNMVKKASSAHFYLLVGLTYTIINRVSILPDGDLVLLPPGNMPSGILITYQRNSYARALLSNNVSVDCFNKPVEHCSTAGDDCLDTNNFKTIEESKAAHAVYGKVITDVETVSDNFEFCSTKFTANGSYQLNIEKTAYNLLCEGRVDDEGLESFRQAYALHPDYETVLEELLKQAGKH